MCVHACARVSQSKFSTYVTGGWVQIILNYMLGTTLTAFVCSYSTSNTF